jgi:hypothetical protein
VIDLDDLLRRLYDYEHCLAGEQETLDLFALLIATGDVWYMCGHYRRTAFRLVEAGLL